MYHNYEVFNREEYGENSITKASRIIDLKFDTTTKQFNFDLQSYLLNDSTGVIQYGNGE